MHFQEIFLSVIQLDYGCPVYSELRVSGIITHVPENGGEYIVITRVDELQSFIDHIKNITRKRKRDTILPDAKY